MQELLDKQSLSKNVELIKGDILVTLKNYLEKNPHLKISLLHIDVDLYEPVKEILEQLYDRVSTGGIIILDDYGTFAGTNKAVDDFFNNRAEVKKLPFSNTISYIVK
jgi:predicted O-methyltransferase YrrM